MDAFASNRAVHKRRHQSRGRRWGLPKDDLTLLSLFSESDDEGGKGVKNLKKLMTSFMNGPNT